MLWMVSMKEFRQRALKRWMMWKQIEAYSWASTNCFEYSLYTLWAYVSRKSLKASTNENFHVNIRHRFQLIRLSFLFQCSQPINGWKHSTELTTFMSRFSHHCFRFYWIFIRKNSGSMRFSSDFLHLNSALEMAEIWNESSLIMQLKMVVLLRNFHPSWRLISKILPQHCSIKRSTLICQPWIAIMTSQPHTPPYRQSKLLFFV